jgi:pimeloyl-ACP methyl ester carboxylesterase
MPRVAVGNITIYYERAGPPAGAGPPARAGSGPSVVLIPGLAGDHFLWRHQIPFLAQHFDVIAPDNRGAGQSSAPDEPYTIGQFADDLAGLLDALSIERAHVIGASMGGFIAQEFALRHPGRLDRLVLCCTSPGGPHSIPIPPETVAMLAQRTGDPRVDTERFLALSTSEAYRASHIADIEAHIAWRAAHPQLVYAYHRQIAAAMSHDTMERLERVRASTLICHGTADRIVPVANAQLLAQRIPDSRVHLFEDGSHQFFWEHAHAFNSLVTEFLTGAVDIPPRATAGKPSGRC